MKSRDSLWPVMGKRLAAVLAAILFVVAPMGIARAEGENLALISRGGTAFTSGPVYSGTAEAAFDGDATTALVIGSGGYSTVTRDFGVPVTMNEVQVTLGGSSTNTAYWSVAVSDNGQDWRQVVAERSFPMSVNSDAATFGPETARYLRVTARSSYDWYNYTEIAVYNSTGASDPDVTAPDVPTGLIATGGVGQVELSWSPSVAADVASYRVYRDGVQVAEVTGTNYTDSGLTGGVTYSYTVSAVDTAGNESDRSVAQVATPTVGERDPVPPDAPTNLTAAPGDRTVVLSWNPPPTGSGDNYRVYRDGSMVSTTTATKWTDTGLTPDTTYVYAVTAMNDAGESPQAVIEVTTLPAGGLDGVQVDLSGLGPTIAAAVGLLFPFALLAAGLIIAWVILVRGLEWLRTGRFVRR